MAYQQDFKKKNQQTEQIGSTPSTSLQAPAGSATGTSQPKAPSSKGTGYTNLSTYVQANQPQGEELSKQITSGIQEGVDTSKTTANQYQTDTESRINQGTAQDNELSTLLGQNPLAFKDQGLKDRFTRQQQGYTGPSNLSNEQPYRNLSSQFQGFDQQISGLQDPAGVRAEISRQKSPDRPQKTGENILDSFLAGSGRGGENLRSFRNNYSDTMDYWNNISNSLNQSVQRGQDLSNQAKDATNQAYSSSLATQQRGIQSAQAQAQTEQQDLQNEYNSLMGSLQDPSVTNYDQIMLQQNAGDWLKSQGLNLGSLISRPEGRTTADIADPNNIDTYQTLLDLTGAQSQFDLNTRTGQTDPGQIDFSKSGIGNQAYETFDQARQRASQQQQQRNQEYAPINEAMQFLQTSGNTSNLDPRVDEYARLLGISSDDFRYGARNDVFTDMNDILTKGGELNAGDVASNQERQSFSDLLQQLGVNQNALLDTQDEGASFDFDQDKLIQSLAYAREQASAGYDPIQISGQTENETTAYVSPTERQNQRLGTESQMTPEQLQEQYNRIVYGDVTGKEAIRAAAEAKGKSYYG